MKLIKYFPMLFLFIAINVIANPIMYATIRGDHRINQPYLQSYFNFDKESLIKFPLNEYSFRIYGYDLKYFDNVPQHERVKDLDGSYMTLSDFKLSIDGRLNLISYDKKTGHYLFKLTFLRPYLDYTGHGPLWIVGGRFFKGNPQVKFLNGSEVSFYIEGVYKTINSKNILRSYNRNPYFDIYTIGGTEKDINLKLLHPFYVFVAK